MNLMMTRPTTSHTPITRRRLIQNAALVGAISRVESPRVNRKRLSVALSDEVLTHQVARHFSVPVLGTALTVEETRWLETVRPGGVHLTGANIDDGARVAELVAAIHATNPGRPPLISVDQEGGPVTILPGDPVAGPAILGQLTPDEIREAATARAEFVRTFGFNLCLAPVADVEFVASSVLAGRCFGSDPEQVATAVGAYVEGAQAVGLPSCAKHFPGHGRTSIDSHLALPEVWVGYEDWLVTDATPFTAAIDADVAMVMLGHLRYPAWPNWGDEPASISREAVRVLREELGYSGVIVTDDLGMDALAAWDPFTVVDLAFAAGVDLLLYVRPPAPVEDLIAHAVSRFASGELDVANLEMSGKRLDEVLDPGEQVSHR